MSTLIPPTPFEADNLFDTVSFEEVVIIVFIFRADWFSLFLYQSVIMFGKSFESKTIEFPPCEITVLPGYVKLFKVKVFLGAVEIVTAGVDWIETLVGLLSVLSWVVISWLLVINGTWETTEGVGVK